MAAATGHIPFLIFLLFITSSSLRTQARLPNIFHKTTHFNVATEDSIPKEEEEEEKQHPVTSTSASQNPNRDGGLYGYSDPEKYYNADAYELYDQDTLKSSPIVTNYNTKEEEDDHDFQLYHDQAIAEKKPLPFTSTSSNHENYYGTGSSSGSSYPAKETYDNRDKQYYYGLENGRYYYDDDINDDAVNGGSRGRGYAASSTSTAQYNYNSNENEMYQQQQQQQGEPRDGFTP